VTTLVGWVLLLLAIGLEVAGTTAAKLSGGFNRLLPSIAIFVLYGISLAIYTLTVRSIPISVSYAVWSGLGTAAIALIGIEGFQEPVSLLKIVSLVLIVAGVIGLNLSGITRG
jgi:small multidrug resistance pump